MNSQILPFPVRKAAQAVTQGLVTGYPEERASRSPSLSAAFPRVMRLQSLIRSTTGNGRIANQAVLYSGHQTVKVEWESKQVDVRLRNKNLVTVVQPTRPGDGKGSLRMQSLQPAGKVLPSVNLFYTVPPSWSDPALVDRAAALWDTLPSDLAHLVNDILWDGGRFYRYVTGPRHPGRAADRNGNFRHAVEVAERAAALGRETLPAAVPLLIAGGLLHDAGKADAFRFDQDSQAFRFSQLGQLLGPRALAIEWVVTARLLGAQDLRETAYLTLLNILRTLPESQQDLEPRLAMTQEA